MNKSAKIEDLPSFASMLIKIYFTRKLFLFFLENQRGEKITFHNIGYCYKS